MFDAVPVEEVDVGEVRLQDVHCARSMACQRRVQPVQVTGNRWARPTSCPTCQSLRRMRPGVLAAWPRVMPLRS